MTNGKRPTPEFRRSSVPFAVQSNVEAPTANGPMQTLELGVVEDRSQFGTVGQAASSMTKVGQS